MEELAAAAAAVTIAKDGNAPGIMGQRDPCGTVNDANAPSLQTEATTNDKDNNDAHAVAREVEDAASKVLNAPHVTCGA